MIHVSDGNDPKPKSNLIQINMIIECTQYDKKFLFNPVTTNDTII